MECRQVQSLFPAYIAGELPEIETKGLQAHLRNCQACSEELAVWQQAQSVLMGVLDCDACPLSSDEQFVASVVSARPGQSSLSEKIAAFLASPRRALAATIGGSFAITAALLLMVWASTLSIPAEHRQPRVQSPLQQYALMMGNADIVEESELHNGS